jgi:hypothetical protein
METPSASWRPARHAGSCAYGRRLRWARKRTSTFEASAPASPRSPTRPGSFPAAGSRFRPGSPGPSRAEPSASGFGSPTSAGAARRARVSESSDAQRCAALGAASIGGPLGVVSRPAAPTGGGPPATEPRTWGIGARPKSTRQAARQPIRSPRTWCTRVSSWDDATPLHAGLGHDARTSQRSGPPVASSATPAYTARTMIG